MKVSYCAIALAFFMVASADGVRAQEWTHYSVRPRGRADTCFTRRLADPDHRYSVSWYVDPRQPKGALPAPEVLHSLTTVIHEWATRCSVETISQDTVMLGRVPGGPGVKGVQVQWTSEGIVTSEAGPHDFLAKFRPLRIYDTELATGWCSFSVAELLLALPPRVPTMNSQTMKAGRPTYEEYKWCADKETSVSQKLVLVRDVLMHEYGHSWGLGNTRYAGSIMFDEILNSTVKYPSTPELHGLQEIYPILRR